jgi:hypothetical protein
MRFSRTAHRRRSPPAFGFPRQGFPALGATTIPYKLIRPHSLGDRAISTRHPKPRLRRCFLADEQREPHPRVLPDLAETLGRVPVPEVAAQPRRNLFISSAIVSGRSGSQRRPVSSRIRSRACRMALSAGQRARNVTGFFPFSPRERTSR